MMVKISLESSLHESSTGSLSLNDQVFQTVKVQLMALGLVDVTYLPSTRGSMGLFWSLSPYGKAMLIQLRSVKATKTPT
jgi:hypothetical protein